MPSPRSQMVALKLPNDLGQIDMHVLDWGNDAAPHTVVCVHGLTRNAQDFSPLAESLSARGIRVMSLDMPGRGDSPWLDDPMRYGYPLYTSACLALLDNYHLRQVDWVGTSMGGIIGMMIAASFPQRIRRLVINDIGAHIDAAGLKRIIAYVSSLPSAFATIDEATQYLRTQFAGFGIKEASMWQHFIASSLRRNENGTWQLKVDPAISEPLRRDTKDYTDIQDVNLAGMWEMVRCPTLILRGEHSDLLSETTFRAMLSSNVRAVGEVIAGCGHAPSLTTQEQIHSISHFLTSQHTIRATAVGA